MIWECRQPIFIFTCVAHDKPRRDRVPSSKGRYAWLRLRRHAESADGARRELIRKPGERHPRGRKRKSARLPGNRYPHLITARALFEAYVQVDRQASRPPECSFRRAHIQPRQRADHVPFMSAKTEIERRR